MPFSVSMACSAFWIVASRVDSWAPSAPRDLRPYCLRRKPPASLTSNSANLRLPAPKSTARNDFVFSIYRRGKARNFLAGMRFLALGPLFVGNGKTADGQMKKRKAPVVPELWLVPREPFRASCDMGYRAAGWAAVRARFLVGRKSTPGSYETFNLATHVTPFL